MSEEEDDIGDTPHHPLNGLDNKIDVRGYFERILSEREKFDAERDRRLEEYKLSVKEALKLQAEEYKRRLHDLNGEYQRDRQRQAGFVSADKYEDKLKSDEEKFKREAEAREAALLRVNEKFDEYVRRYEQDKRDIQVLMAAQKAAAEAAERAAEKFAQEAKDKADDLAEENKIKLEQQGRRTNRNLQYMGLALAAFVFLANFLPSIIPG